MKLQQRIDILKQLGDYMRSGTPEWEMIKTDAARANGWFLPEFVELATNGIVNNFLDENKLENWATDHHLSDEPQPVKLVGVVMAGNIPLVGFHDFLSVFLSGHRQKIKLSSKDNILLKHLTEKMIGWHPGIAERVFFSDLLKNCDAYIATGSDNSARYFEQYFGKYPNIIRRNRTSVAILDGTETPLHLSLLADDIQQYFGLGCRNVTHLCVPKGYDFVPVLEALKKYDYFMDAHKYKHNFDYNLALPLINNQFYMTNGSIVVLENPSLFSPIAQIHYQFYTDRDKLSGFLPSDQVQCFIGKGLTEFGQAQQPGLNDYADGINTMAFLSSLTFQSID